MRSSDLGLEGSCACGEFQWAQHSTTAQRTLSGLDGRGGGGFTSPST